MKPQQNKELMVCFDPPCGALFRGASRWPETNLKGNHCPASPSHIQNSQSLISWPHKTAALCAQSATHQNTAFKGSPRRCSIQESLKNSND